MVNFIKENWKLILAILYAIFVPLYFYKNTKALEIALDTTRNSSQKQINVLHNALDEQTEYYDNLFQEYQDRIEAEEIRYNQELEDIKTVQDKQQKELSKRFKNNPSAISDELKKRYNLSDK
jgi:uncharacterized membrane-anchored protein YhcB (DUF1043 family)